MEANETGLPWRFEFTSTEHDLRMECVQLCKDSPWWWTWPKGEPLPSTFPTWHYTAVVWKLESGEWKRIVPGLRQRLIDWWNA